MRMRWLHVRWTAFLLVLLVAGGLAAMSVGRYPVAARDIVQFLAAATGLREMPKDRLDLLHNIIVEIRLPRVLTAMLVGGALATSGAAYQAVFRNPLVSPELMGVLLARRSGS